MAKGLVVRVFRVLLCVGVLLLPSLAGFPAEDSAPSCPPAPHPAGDLPNGYVWEHEDGVDFTVYRAHPKQSRESELGVYVGFFPDTFVKQVDASKEPGRVADQSVTWVNGDKVQNGVTFLVRETHFDYGQGPNCPKYKLHVWIITGKKDELNTLLESARHLKFTPSDTPRNNGP